METCTKKQEEDEKGATTEKVCQQVESKSVPSTKVEANNDISTYQVDSAVKNAKESHKTSDSNVTNGKSVNGTEIKESKVQQATEAASKDLPNLSEENSKKCTGQENAMPNGKADSPGETRQMNGAGGSAEEEFPLSRPIISVDITKIEPSDDKTTASKKKADSTSEPTIKSEIKTTEVPPEIVASVVTSAVVNEAAAKLNESGTGAKPVCDTTKVKDKVQEELQKLADMPSKDSNTLNGHTLVNGELHHSPVNTQVDSKLNTSATKDEESNVQNKEIPKVEDKVDLSKDSPTPPIETIKSADSEISRKSTSSPVSLNEKDKTVSEKLNESKQTEKTEPNLIGAEKEKCKETTKDVDEKSVERPVSAEAKEDGEIKTTENKEELKASEVKSKVESQEGPEKVSPKKSVEVPESSLPEDQKSKPSEETTRVEPEQKTCRPAVTTCDVGVGLQPRVVKVAAMDDEAEEVDGEQPSTEVQMTDDTTPEDSNLAPQTEENVSRPSSDTSPTESKRSSATSKTSQPDGEAPAKSSSAVSRKSIPDPGVYEPPERTKSSKSTTSAISDTSDTEKAKSVTPEIGTPEKVAAKEEVGEAQKETKENKGDQEEEKAFSPAPEIKIDESKPESPKPEQVEDLPPKSAGSERVSTAKGESPDVEEAIQKESLEETKAEEETNLKEDQGNLEEGKEKDEKEELSAPKEDAEEVEKESEKSNESPSHVVEGKEEKEMEEQQETEVASKDSKEIVSISPDVGKEAEAEDERGKSPEASDSRNESQDAVSVPEGTEDDEAKAKASSPQPETEAAQEKAESNAASPVPGKETPTERPASSAKEKEDGEKSEEPAVEDAKTDEGNEEESKKGEDNSESEAKAEDDKETGKIEEEKEATADEEEVKVVGEETKATEEETEVKVEEKETEETVEETKGSQEEVVEEKAAEPKAVEGEEEKGSEKEEEAEPEQEEKTKQEEEKGETKQEEEEGETKQEEEGETKDGAVVEEEAEAKDAESKEDEEAVKPEATETTTEGADEKKDDEKPESPPKSPVKRVRSPEKSGRRGVSPLSSPPKTLKTPPSPKKPQKTMTSPRKKNGLLSPIKTPKTPGSDGRKLPPIKAPVGLAPNPNLKNIKSKIGSFDNIKYKPGGGDKKVVSIKLDWKAAPKIGSLERSERRAKEKSTSGEDAKETKVSDFQSADDMEGDLALTAQPIIKPGATSGPIATES